MKAIKKTLATLLCLCLMLGCVCFTAFAEGEATGTITVQDQSGSNATVAGKTLNLFKIFSATSSGSNISYQWIKDGNVNRYASFFFGDAAKGFAKRVDGDSINDVVAYIDSLKDNSFEFSKMAADLHDYIHAYSIASDDSITVGDATSCTFKNLTLGYYLIYDATVLPTDSPAVRSAAMLAHPGENKVIQLKADRPHIEKYVDDNNAADAVDWKKGTTASIGDVVNFRIVTAIPNHDLYGDQYTFEISDTMADTLKLDPDSIVVTLTAPQGAAAVLGTHYTLDKAPTDGSDFKVTMTNITTLPVSTLVEITYSAEVLATAEKLNVNEVSLKYSNDPHTASSFGEVSSTANVMVWQLTLTKYLEDASGNPSYKRLGGAEFEIYKVVNGVETKLHFSNNTTLTNGEVTYVKYILDASSDNTVLATLNAGTGVDDGSADIGRTDGGYLGQILIFGLGEGTYRIREIKAPDGYQKADGVFEFTLTDTVGPTGAVSDSSVSHINPEKPGQFTRVSADSTNVKYYIGITNAPGSALPETGGIGTTIFTVLGVILMVGAAAFFTSRKRSSVA